MTTEIEPGLVYRVHHHRKYRTINVGHMDEDVVLDPKGGHTIVEIGQLVDAVDGTKRFVPSVSARADCSVKDTYNRKRGRDIALGRALKIYGG